MNKVLITAHAGCEATRQDSLEALKAALALQADCVEVDVRLDGDGRPVLSHDKREQYIGAVPLAQAFQLVADAGVSVNCDLKEPAALYPVLALAKTHGLDQRQLIFTGAVSCDLLAADPGILRRCQVFLNIEELMKHLLAAQTADFPQLLTQPWQQLRPVYAALARERLGWIAFAACSLGVEVLNLPYEGLSHERIAAFREQGLKLSLWTVDGEEDLTRLLQEDIHNITTKNVSAALRLRASLTTSHHKENGHGKV